MAKAPSLDSASSGGAAAALRRRWPAPARSHLFRYPVRASQSDEGRNERVFKELGLFSMKKKIEDAVSRAEIVAPTALELEEANRIKQEKRLREHNLWDDLARSNESLTALVDAIKMVDNLKDVQYKAEEAKLITQLAEMDTINDQLFEQAYKTSIDVNKLLDCYEMSKLLKGPYDKEGACVIIRAGPEGITSEVWAEKLLSMYIKWARKHGYKGRVVEKYPSKHGGITEAIIEFESEYACGYLSGEGGTHRMICSSLDGYVSPVTCSAGVDVIPLFIERTIDLHIDENDLEITSPSFNRVNQSGCKVKSRVSIHHIPSGTTVQCSGERSHFSNKIKALNRLKAKLLVTAKEQGVPEVSQIKKDAVRNVWEHETRRYVFHPHKSVHDTQTGLQLSDLDSVLEGNIECLLRAHISIR